MKRYLYNLDIYAGEGLVRGGSMLFKDGRIAGIWPGMHREVAAGTEAAGGEVLDCRGRFAVPGYIDCHVHGGDGHDINDCTAGSIRKTRDFYGRHGVTTIFPSYLALKLEDLETGLEAVREVRRENAPGLPVVERAHLEGPFLNPQYKGSQPEEQIVPIDDSNVLIFERGRDAIARTTIAPEYGRNAEYFPGIAALGIQISMGHSCATITQAREAARKGATSVTHIYNAMSQTHKEGPWRIGGLVEAGLTIDNLYAEAICDGCHLPDELLRIVWKCKGPRKMLMVSDACLCAGLPSGTVVKTAGMNFYVEDGVSMNEARTSFASSTSPLDKMVRHLVFSTKLPAEDVFEMASATPARMLGIFDHTGSIEVGKDADVNLLDPQFNVTRTFFKGE
ncbi:MAG: N-acetylglucosamine-6-phosphate deacetylase [Bacteroidales bacterium]|nr:N-acetylglucosamine-6-phosphate deacetylase [Bacteroidales bacterium]